MSPPKEDAAAKDSSGGALHLVRRAARYYRVALGTFVVGVGIAGIVAFQVKPIFKSETVLLYRQISRPGGDSEGGESARRAGQRLQDMVFARDRLEKMIKELGLYTPLVKKRGYVEAVDEMRRRISFSVRESSTFRISFESTSPAMAHTVTTKLAALLIEENSRLRLLEADETKRFLDAEKLKIDAEFKTKETELAHFLVMHPEFAAESGRGDASAGASIRAARVGDAGDPALFSLEMSAAQLRERLAAATGARQPVRSATGVLLDPELVAAKARADAALAAAQRELAERQTKLTDRHPDVATAKARLDIAAAEARRAAELLAAAPTRPAPAPASAAVVVAEPETVRSIRHQLGLVEGQLGALRAAKKRAVRPGKADPGQIVELETQWTRLNREVSETRERHRQLEDKQFQASLVATMETSGQGGQMVVVDPPFVPTRAVRSSRRLAAGMGLALAAFVSLSVALGFALLDDRLYDAVDVERLGLAPVLAVVPKAGGHGNAHG